MKINLMLKYFISIITFLFVNITIGNVKIANDTLEKFGVRAGLDLNKIIRSATDEDYSGLVGSATIHDLTDHSSYSSLLLRPLPDTCRYCFHPFISPIATVSNACRLIKI